MGFKTCRGAGALLPVESSSAAAGVARFGSYEKKKKKKKKKKADFKISYNRKLLRILFILLLLLLSLSASSSSSGKSSHTLQDQPPMLPVRATANSQLKKTNLRGMIRFSHGSINYFDGLVIKRRNTSYR
jgi:hypothetical protein